MVKILSKITKALSNIAAIVLVVVMSYAFSFVSVAHADYSATTTATTSGAFTVPAGVTSLTVTVTGAGAGGGGGAFTYGGGGGGAGASFTTIIPVTAGQVIPYFVGVGGAAGTTGSFSVSGGNGGNGGNTTFGTTTALGGKGGQGAILGLGNGLGGLGGIPSATANGTDGANFIGQRTYGGNGGTTPFGFGGTQGTGDANSYTLPVAGTNGNGGGGASGWAYYANTTYRDAGANGGNGLIRIAYTADLTAPVIYLTGANPLTLNASTTAVYVDAGATAFDATFGTTSPTIIFNNVNLAATGTYSVVYSATDLAGNTATTSRTVIVHDITAPTIVAPATQIFEATGATTTPILVPAIGADDFSTTTISYTPASFALGTTTVTWTARDTSGNIATTTSQVVIKDTTGPAIVLNGFNPMSVMFLSTFTDPFATAFDLVNGTTTVNATGTVATNVLGTSTILYSSQDSLGNISTSSRTVVVVATTPALAALTISPLNLSTTVGTTTQFVASTTDQYGNPFASPVFWGSLNPTVGSINFSTGVFTALSAGTTTIQANSGSFTATTTVTVTVVSPVLTTITIAPLNLSTTVGTTTQFTASTSDQFGNPFATSTTWSSSNATVGTISSSTGLFTAASVGTTTITAVAGSLSTSTIVTVNAVVVIPTLPVNITNSLINSVYYASIATTSGAIANITGTTTLTSATVNSSSIDNSVVSTSTVINSTISFCTVLDSTLINFTGTHCYIDPTTMTDTYGTGNSGNYASSTGTTTINSVNFDYSWIDNSVVIHSTVNYSSTTFAYIKDATVMNSVVNNSTTTNSTIATSTITNGSVVSNSSVSLSTLNNAQLSNNSTSTNSSVTNSTLNNAAITNSTSTGSNLASSTVSAGSVITNSTITGSTVASSTLTNVVMASSTISGTTLTNATTTNAVISNGTIYSGTITIGGNTYVISTPTLISSLGADTTAPMITINGANPLSLTASSTGVYVDLGATAYDVFDNATTTATSTNNVDMTTAGTYSVVYTASDIAGNVATSSRVVIITSGGGGPTDTVAPVITVNGANPLTLVASSTGTYSDLGATAYDVFDAATTTASTTSNNVNIAVAGNYTVTYSASDIAGNVATSSRAVTVTATPDTIAPTITILGANPATTTVGSVYNDAGATAFDLVSGTTTVSSTSTVNTTLAGTYSVVYTSQDGAGNIATSSRTVIVTSAPDITAPVISVLGANPVTIVTGTNYVDAGATANDNIDGNVTASIVTTNPVSSTTPVGTYTVTYAVADAAGNGAASTRTVMVTATPDTTAPTITILGSNPVTLLVGAIYTDAGATANDLVSGNLTANIATSSNVNTAATGTYSVVYSVADGAGNTAVATRTVSVIASPVDTIAPVISITGGTPITVSVGATYTDAGATANDNIDGNVTASIVTTGLPVNTSATGTFSVVYTVSDVAGNTAVATRTVNVIAAAADLTAPTIFITGGTPITVVASSTYNDQGATATDNVDPIVNVSATGTVDTNILGTYFITYSATDAASNTATAVRTVNVVIATTTDNIPPVITLNSGTPVTITVGTSYVDAGATATDNVDGNVTANIATSTNLNINVIGSYTFTYTVSDVAGNIAAAVRGINVIAAAADLTAPVITLNGGSPISVAASSTYTELGATAFDAVDGTTTVSIGGSVNTNILGTYIVTYTATDIAGNVASTTRTVNVIAQDTIAPLITLIGANPMTVVKTQAYVEAGANAIDNVDGILLVNISGVVNVNATGTYAVVYTATDSSGNVASTTRVVNVVPDTTAPTITITGANPTNVTVGGTYTELGATATDNVDPSVTVTATGTVNTAVIGAYSITYSATDVAGNTATAVRTVNVTAVVVVVTPPASSGGGGAATYYDITKPVITILGANPVSVALGAVYTDAGATSVDNKDGNITSGIQVGSSVNTATAGSYTVTYTSIDAAGNSATAVRTVNVIGSGTNTGTNNSGSTATSTTGTNIIPTPTTGNGNVSTPIVPGNTNTGTGSTLENGLTIPTGIGQTNSNTDATNTVVSVNDEASSTSAQNNLVATVLGAFSNMSKTTAAGIILLLAAIGFVSFLLFKRPKADEPSTMEF